MIPPTTITGVTDVRSFSAGAEHVCAVRRAGTVTCWGLTGPGVTIPNPVPADVAGLTEVVQVAAGNQFTCALRADHTVACWGSNHYGQLGNTTNIGTDVNNPIPATVTGVSTAVAVAAGGRFACAILADTTVSCWGSNTGGELGSRTNNRTADGVPTPAVIPGLSGVSALALGSMPYSDNEGGNACALLSAGTVTCWGDNYFGQLGNSKNTSSFAPNPVPKAVAGVTGVVAVSAGTTTSCALQSSGSIVCWGDGNSGEMGSTNDGTPRQDVVNPYMSGVLGIMSGWTHMCGLLAGGAVSCWGFDRDGQSGYAPTRTQLPMPMPRVIW
jgi:alpha-tubulin suppressor-like RCC1 family protein